LSKVLLVDGEPNNFKISFLFDSLTVSFSCFLFKKKTPWCFSTFFKVQAEINNDIIINTNNFLMDKNYINIYNNLVQLTRNKDLYKDFKNQDTFSDRLIFFLLHFAFFLKVYKENNDKKILQEIYDFTFRQVELSIREIGYGDQSINKKMKDYLNLFYGMIDKIHSWDELDIESRNSILVNFLDNSSNIEYLVNYFENYRLNLKNNTLNSYIKGVVKH
jgi:cytochrome b pre-mRNA-processing protein 3